MKDPPLVRFRKKMVWRMIPSRFPPIDLFRDVAPAGDWELLNEFEGRTNQRLAEQAMSRGLIREEDRVEKSSSHYILGPLAHPNPEGSRFSDGTFGVLYAGLDFETTLEEVKSQREAFFRRTAEKPQRFDMRVIVMQLDGMLHDIREFGTGIGNDARNRKLAIKLRAAGSFGIVYGRSAKSDGNCVAVFRPPVLSECRQERHLAFVWNGKSVVEVIEYAVKSEPAQRVI